MDVTEEFAADLAEVSRLLEDETDQPAVLDRLVRRAVQIVPGCSGAVMTVRGPKGSETVAVSDRGLVAVHEAQFRDGGPGAEALRHGEPRRVDDTAGERRWPSFARAAAAGGWCSCLALPLDTSTDSVGVLCLYGSEPRTFTGVAHDVALLFAAGGATGLANAALYQASRRMVENLRRALVVRAVIEQAKGVLVARDGCRPEEAMATLRRASQQANVPVRQIAERLVGGAVQPPERTEPTG